MRTHLMLPDEMVADIDKLVGKGKRSKFIEEAVQEKLLKALRDSFGTLSDEDYPEWSTLDKVAQGVHDLRRRDVEHLQQKPSRD